MVDRRPQDFPSGTPDGVSDNTAAIQAAIDAWQSGDQVIISGGTFRTSAPLAIGQNGLLLKGDGAIKARAVAHTSSSRINGTWSDGRPHPRQVSSTRCAVAWGARLGEHHI